MEQTSAFDQHRKEAYDAREWFKSQWGEGASVRVLDQDSGAYDTTVTESQVVEQGDGSLQFKVTVVVDGAYLTYTSDRPDEFVGLALLG